MKILHLISTLNHTGAAAQLGVLLKRAPAAQQHRVCCTEAEGSLAPRLRAFGIHVDCLAWTRAFDPTPPWRLRQLLHDASPDCVHVWGLRPLRALGLVGRRWLSQTLVSRPAPYSVKQIRAFDRWLLRRVRGVVATSQAEAALCRDIGVSASRVSVIPPGVEVPCPAPADTAHTARRILCVGALERHKGLRDAIWAFDILRYVYPDVRFALAGTGSQRDDLHWFATQLEASSQIDFLGPRDDVSDLLAQSSLYWAPTPTLTHGQTVLEAMAAGRPVVAADQPALRELIDDGITGYLVPSGDKVAIGKRTRGLILDPELAHALGARARRHVERNFSAALCQQRWADQYDAGSTPRP